MHTLPSPASLRTSPGCSPDTLWHWLAPRFLYGNRGSTTCQSRWKKTQPRKAHTIPFSKCCQSIPRCIQSSLHSQVLRQTFQDCTHHRRKISKVNTCQPHTTRTLEMPQQDYSCPQSKQRKMLHSREMLSVPDTPRRTLPLDQERLFLKRKRDRRSHSHSGCRTQGNNQCTSTPYRGR